MSYQLSSVIYSSFRFHCNSNDFFHLFQGHDVITKKVRAADPVIIFDILTKKYYLYHDKSIICKIDDIYGAFLSLICLFYCLDLDFPSQAELGFCFFQNLILQDSTCPQEVLSAVTNMLNKFNAYKTV